MRQSGFVQLEINSSPFQFTLHGLTDDVSGDAHACYRHIGPYHLLGNAHAAMHAELEKIDASVTRPSLEIFGHWQEDESKLETDILLPLEMSG